MISKDENHVLFLQRGPEWSLFEYLVKNDIKVSIVNTEQMTRYKIECKNGNEVPFPFDFFLMSYIRSGKLHSIIDYSLENIHIWQELFWKLNTKLHCFKPSCEEKQIQEKSKDVVFVGDANSQYRQTILLQVKPNMLTSCYGKIRDEELYKHRILLNLHFGSQYCIFEELRCLPCVLAQMIVVSENSKFDVHHPLHKFIVFVEYEKLPQKITEIKTNYNIVWKSIYEDQKSSFQSLLNDIAQYEKQSR